MLPFNLAKSKIIERDCCKEYMMRRVRIIVLLTGFTVLMAVGSYTCKTVIAGRVTLVRSQLSDAETRCNKLEKDLAVVRTSEGRTRWTQKLALQSSRRLDILNAVLCSAPDGVSFGKVQSSDKDLTVLIDGYAQSIESLLSFMAALKNSPEFSAVHLNTSRTEKTGDRSYVGFSLTLDLSDKSKESSAPAGQVPNIKESP